MSGSNIDPNFITAAPVSKAGMRLQLSRAKDEITALQDGVAAINAALTVQTSSVLGRTAAGTGPVGRIALGNAAPALSLGISRGVKQLTNTGQVQHDFTGIPAGVREITIMFRYIIVSSGPITVQLGTSGGFVTSGYETFGARLDTNGVNPFFITSGIVCIPIFGSSVSGCVVLSEIDTNEWVAHGSGIIATTSRGFVTGGAAPVLGSVLTQIRLTASGSAFGGGSANISWKF